MRACNLSIYFAYKHTLQVRGCRSTSGMTLSSCRIMTSSNRIDAPYHIGFTKPNSATTHTAISSSQHAVNDPHNHINVESSSDDEQRQLYAFGHKSVLQSDALYQYILETNVYPRENPYLRELREITEKHPWSCLSTPPDEGQFLMLLMKLINAKNTMELGVYTGYSLLCTAISLPDDGMIIAMDKDRETYELGAAVIEKAGLSHKVDFREGLILPQLDSMVLQEGNLGYFDFIFVDADKDNYVNYHERVMKLVKVGGVIGYDNTLLYGSVADPKDASSYDPFVRQMRPFVLEINQVLAEDERIEISQVPVGDGLTLCRKIK